MFKKLLPLIIVLALLAGYAGYRAVSAQSNPSGAAKLAAPSSQSGQALTPSTGAAQIKTWTNLSTGDVERAKSCDKVDGSGGDCRRYASPRYESRIMFIC